MLQVQIKSDSPDVEIVQNLIKGAIESEIKNLQRSLEKTNKLLQEFLAIYLSLRFWGGLMLNFWRKYKKKK